MTLGRFDISLNALKLATRGKAYDLCSGWWPGMPIASGHPAFQVMTYRTPSGQRNQKDLSFLANNPDNYGFITELLMCTVHTGTHIDALAHVTCGPDSSWHGGFTAEEHLGDFGPMANDASDLPPMISRGVMLDIPLALGVQTLKSRQEIGPAELQLACSRQSVALLPDDVVLLRTGTMRNWPDREVLEQTDGCGLNLEGARWISQFSPRVVGADNGDA